MSVIFLTDGDKIELQKELDSKAKNKGWNANKYLGTDESGHIVEKEAPSNSGGMSATSLPEVTTEDNGKVLMVVNGEWAIGTIENANGVLSTIEPQYTTHINEVIMEVG